MNDDGDPVYESPGARKARKRREKQRADDLEMECRRQHEADQKIERANALIADIEPVLDLNAMADRIQALEHLVRKLTARWHD